MRRFFVFAYGLCNYLGFLATFLYLVGFVGNLWVPLSMDSAPVGPLWQALLINTLLIGLFGVQHTVMARPTFKRWWTRFVPKPMERSTYVMFTNAALVLLFVFWRPMGGVVWDIQQPLARGILYALFALGWGIVLVTTFLINHFDLFGLRQVWLHFRGKPYTHIGFRTPGPYRFVRHPLYVGWLIAFWSTPTMTAAHFVFALGMTAYILIAIPFEERNLAEFHGTAYTDYLRRVPMLIPGLSRNHRLPREGTSPVVTAQPESPVNPRTAS
jgi:protein-S-isoprenylcysteine O-methyltransferase Ste14